MRILGISAFYHDSAAALLADGRIVAAAQEERFTRKKQDARFPAHAIAYCLKEGRCTISDVDYVVFYEKPFLKFERLLATKSDAIYLANPNAPSGTFVSPMKVAELAKQFPGLVLVDEAYADFADDNCLVLVKEYPNVVISRTLSKAYSLAGLRFGYAVAQPPLDPSVAPRAEGWRTVPATPPSPQ